MWRFDICHTPVLMYVSFILKVIICTNKRGEHLKYTVIRYFHYVTAVTFFKIIFLVVCSMLKRTVCEGTAVACCCLRDFSFLGAFFRRVAKKASVSFVLSVRIEQLDSHWTYFHEVWYLNIILKSVRKIRSCPPRKTSAWHDQSAIFNNISLSSSYSEKCFRQKL
jgi:hypothetical protein